MNETALISAAQEGDLDDFNKLILFYQQRVFNLALRILNDPDMAEDAAQISFISAYKNISKFKGGSFRAWMMRIVTNKCYDELRRRHRHPVQPLKPLRRENEEEMEDPTWMQNKESSLPEIIEQKELEKAIQSCIEALPPEFRIIVLLIDVQDIDYKEACQIVKKPLGTVKSRLSRARQKLQKCLQGFWELLPEKFRLKSEDS